MAANFTIKTTFAAIDNMSTPLDKVIKKTKHLGDSVDKTGGMIKKAFNVGALAVTAFGTAVLGAGVHFINAASEVEKYKTTLNVMLGSQEAANKRFEEMSKFAAKTPFELKDVVQLGNQLQALGKYSIENMTILGDLASAAGKPIDQVSGAFAKLATGQKGVAVDMFRDLLITTDDWVKATGKGISKSGELLATTEEMLSVLPSILAAKGFSGMMEEQSKTFSGKLSNMKDSFFNFSAAIGEAILTNAGKAIGKTGDIIGMLTDKVNANKETISKFAGEVFETINSIIEIAIPLVMTFLNVLQPAFSLINTLAKALIVIFQKIAPIFEKIIPAVVAFATLIGEALIPIILEVFESLSPLLNILGFLIDMITGVIKIVTGLVKWLSFLTPIITGLIIAFGAYSAIMTTIQVVTGLVTTAQLLWNLALSANPIGLVVIAIGALIGIALLLVKNWEAVSNFFKGVWDTLVSGFQWVVSNFTGILTAIGSGISKFVGPILEIPMLIIKNWEIISTFFSNLFSGIGSLIEGFISGPILSFIDGIGAAINGALEFLGLKAKTDNAQKNISYAAPAVTTQEQAMAKTPISSNTTITRNSTVDVNFNNPPAGTAIKQQGYAPGINLNTGKVGLR